MLVDAAMRHDWVWQTTNRAATSVWIPPGKAELTDAEAAAIEALVAASLGEGADRVSHIFETFDEAHHRHAEEPHYYLSILATDPAQTGHGYGLGLLAANLEAIDREHQPAYLEASNPANVPLYQRYGFEVDSVFDLPDGGPTVTTMWRPARQTTA
jgi:GNAT superfamily N-acetyltransferase